MSQEQAGGGPPGLPRGCSWQVGRGRALPPAAAGSRARPMWGDCTSSMVFGCWVLLGAQAGVDFGRDGDWLVRQTPSWQSRILRHVTPARPPPSLTAPGRQLSFCRRGRDLEQRRAAGRADAAAEQRAVPPRGRVPAGRRRRRLRWRGPAGPAHSPSQTKAWKVALPI